MSAIARTSKDEFLLARATVARRLVKQGLLHPEVALSLAVWPPPAVLEAEQAVPRGTIVGRVYREALYQ